MGKRQLGLAAAFGALLLAASGCALPGAQPEEPALSDLSGAASLASPRRGLGGEREPLAPIIQDVYSKSIPDDVYSEGQ